MPLSVLAMVLASVANYSVYRALQGWIGPRPGHRLLVMTCVLMPVGYALSFDHYALRVGWANAAGAEQLDTRIRTELLQRSKLELGWPVNFSTGLAMCHLTDADPLTAATQAADQALYVAKRLGRGRLMAAPQHPTPTSPGVDAVITTAGQ